MIRFDPILLHEWLRHTAGRLPDKTAVIDGSREISYERLDRESDRLARRLLELGLRFQDRVIIYLDNSYETVLSLYAVLKAGGVFVILNGALKAAKLAYIIDNSEAAFLISAPSNLPQVQEALRRTDRPPTVLWTERRPGMKGLLPDSLCLPSLLEKDPSPAPDFPEIIDQDIAAFIYTSGSTGEPKGIISTHHAMVSAARSIIQYVQNDPDDVILDVLPLSFDYGLYQVLMSVMFGGTVILEKSFTFLHQVLRNIPRHGVTGFPIVPAILAMLLNLKDLNRCDFTSLRYMTNTGAALPTEHIRRFRQAFPDVRFYSMFGLSECKRVCYLPPEWIGRKPDSVGRPMPNCRVFVLDDADAPVPPGQIGELVVQGSNVMSGYWKDPELTARTYRPGPVSGQRLLYSGDYFRRDEDGFLYFLGRRDNMIKTRGERVSPKEIENILCQCKGVEEAAVIGIPDPILGQVPKAFIVPSDPAVTVSDVLRYARQNMENFMVPKEFEFLDALPKTPNAKIDKKLLKQRTADLPSPQN